jgi:hypothetical protein
LGEIGIHLVVVPFGEYLHVPSFCAYESLAAIEREINTHGELFLALKNSRSKAINLLTLFRAWDIHPKFDIQIYHHHQKSPNRLFRKVLAAARAGCGPKTSDQRQSNHRMLGSELTAPEIPSDSSSLEPIFANENQDSTDNS